MLAFVSLPIELLRTRPRVLVWLAVLAQAVLWLLVPALLYGSPPGGVPELLAVAHRWPQGGPSGPPLAFWAAELAFRALGPSGVYLLSQVCVAVAMLALFALGRRIVGDSHAAIAVLLTVGTLLFALPSPEFGPAVLTLPLWTLALAHLWFAVGEGRRLWWIAVGVEIGLLILTSYANLLLVALLAGFVASQERGRASFEDVEPYLGGLAAMLVLFQHLIWIDRPGATFPVLAGLAAFARAAGWLAAVAALAHLGPALLVGLSRGLPGDRRKVAPEIERPPVAAEARRFVSVFALVPLALLVPFALLPGHTGAIAAAPAVALSGLGVVVALGERIRIVRQRAVVLALAGLLAAPPILAVAVMALAPTVSGTVFRVTLPSGEMGRFFAANFERRTGRPLAVATGDSRLAALVALGAPGRPDLLRLERPELSPAVSRADVAAKGAVVVWPARDTRGLPPPDIAAAFPGLVPEVPQTFRRRLQLFGPPLRLGWAVIRPTGP